MQTKGKGSKIEQLARDTTLLLSVTRAFTGQRLTAQQVESLHLTKD